MQISYHLPGLVIPGRRVKLDFEKFPRNWSSLEPGDKIEHGLAGK